MGRAWKNMNNQIHENWGGHSVRLTWCPLKVLTDSQTITSVHGYCFYQDNILLVQVSGRGFNVPGGHVELNETADEAFHREAFEEGYVKGRIKYIGAIEVSHEDNPLFVPNGKYPLIGFQVFYRMDIEECLPFLRENETLSRIWVEPKEVPYVINDHALSTLVLKGVLKMGKALFN